MRTILISGANRGIGLNIAHRELKAGNRISIGIRDLESIKGSVIDPNNWRKDKILINKYDALDKLSAEKWIKNTISNFGGFDSLINCSGILSKIPFLYKDGDEKEILNTLNINFLAIWNLCRLSWEHLSKSNNGRIIVLVSMSGKRSKGDLAAYSASKFALMSLCQTIKNKGWEENIRVTAICPGWVNTDMAEKISSLEKSKMTQPNDIAEICSTILKLPMQSVPFEIALNCNHEI
ncbi:Short-chain dehydrogenase/reductase (SDR) superfamily [Prochlorococcus marinus str. MIT 9515]|uniref:Short-chain dehydrogenase/reductase (SDR) superfamily n=1 Tax=Prochlorococcus marinus (strain MIT 9515) TaxID=167542 RepID=A2BVU6_PROM5|nr:SDR family NAD(P)-dependent oxidoreductase [Prochlorococcus marinus]ABM71907.1 Short-chain dehydrogenase/reductase (SDR) superfamily [Prochlorococcus marinus str. MIT 9515]